MTQETVQDTELDWNSLVLDKHPTREEIHFCVYEAPTANGWQALRMQLHGTSLQWRWTQLKRWLNWEINSDDLKTIHTEYQRGVQVSNYVLALKRGGMWK